MAFVFIRRNLLDKKKEVEHFWLLKVSILHFKIPKFFKCLKV